MANNNVSSLLNISFPEPKQSNFNLGRVNRFSADVGWVIPCYVEEILPNSYKRLDVEALIQTNATVAPLMGSFKVKVDCFFVPLRLYYRHLSLNNINPDFTDNFGLHYIPIPNFDNSVQVDSLSGQNAVPITDTSSYAVTYYKYNDLWYENNQTSSAFNQCLQVAPSSLIDYLGILPVGFHNFAFKGFKKLNGNPFIAYFDIWRNYYANPHDINVPMRISNNTYIDDNDQRALSYNDTYIPLSVFDDFIRNISTRSLSNATPQQLDVLSIFNDTVTRSSPGGMPSNLKFMMNIPLFSGQAVTSSYVSGASIPKADTRNGMHFGLLRCTYMDDYFNSRFRNEFVSYMEDKSKVTVQNNQFTISQLRMQNRIAKYVDKSIFSDTRFGSWIKAHFGVKTNNKLDIPQFLGSISSNIIFNDIYSLAQTGNGGITANQALGSRASLGQGYINNKGSFVEFKATEPGFIMCMFRIIPYVSYFQGIKKMYLKTNFQDMYKPEYDAVGYDDLQTLEMCALSEYFDNFQRERPTSFTPIDINTFNVSLGKHPAYMEYMTSFDEVHGLFAKKFDYGFWTLNRPVNDKFYNQVSEEFSSFEMLNVSTYVTPEYYNSIFAVDKYTDNFQVQIRFYDKTKQPMSKQILPHL